MSLGLDRQARSMASAAKEREGTRPLSPPHRLICPALGGVFLLPITLRMVPPVLLRHTGATNFCCIYAWIFTIWLETRDGRLFSSGLGLAKTVC